MKSQNVSMEIPTDKLGPSGIRWQLHVQTLPAPFEWGDRLA
jgi:hypothetical protein